MKRIILLLIYCFILSCSTPEKIVVTNIHDLAAHKPNSYIYSIPRTRIAITISAIRYVIFPGPYNEFADKYLGIEGVPSLSKSEWEIHAVTITPVIESDPEYYFSIQTNNPTYILDRLLELSAVGLILKPDSFISFLDFSSSFDDIPEPIHFTDLSVKRNYKEELPDRESRRTGTSVPIDMPVIKQKEKVKSKEEKAREAADFIIKIRKRRFKLLAGQYDVFPEGQALETSIRELNALEKEYLSLFIGKTYSDTIKRTYFYAPQSGQDLERNVFCRFSDETGFYEATSASGRPLVLELKNLQFTDGLKQLQLPYGGTSYENIILYRIPDNASVKIFYGSNTILEAETKIYQYGSFVPYYLPKNK